MAAEGALMQLRSARIRNFKPFLDTGPIEFGAGFNVIIGRNNVGKTALLDALTPGHSGSPHRSSETMQNEGDAPDPRSLTDYVFEATGRELADAGRLLHEWELVIPQAAATGENRRQAAEDALQQFLSQQQASVQCQLVSEGPNSRWTENDQGAGVTIPYSPGRQSANFAYASVRVEADRRSMRIRNSPQWNGERPIDMSAKFGATLAQGIYKFSAERLNIASAKIGSQQVLASNCQNLAEVLHVLLTTNYPRFKTYEAHVASIFPDIHAITVPLVQGRTDAVEVKVWQEPSASQRADLARSLADCGTGLGQVMAILYVALTSKKPQVIIIDEPQSFLHPGALRKLLEILAKEGAQHQYILSSHSPQVVSSSNPSFVHLVYRDGLQSKVRKIDQKEREGAVQLLAEVGARFSDVFGADEVLWVEGPTEERSMPLIISHFDIALPDATKVLGVLSVSDFETRRAEDAARVASLYSKLSAGGALIPPAVRFLFDREGRSESQRAELRGRLGERVAFLQRRMFENYLLQPGPIAATITELLGPSPERWASPEVERILNQMRGNQPILEWLNEVDGAKVLSDLFEQMTQNRLIYRKSKHAEILTRHCLATEPESLRPLADEIAIAVRGS